MKKIIRELNIDKIGLYELLIAVFPVLLPFTVVSIGVLLFLIVLSLGKPGRKEVYKPFIILILYVLLHDVGLFITMIDVPGTFVNNTIQNIIYFSAIIILTRSVNIEKMIGAINLVAVICICGMIYQAIQVARGQTIQPLIFMFQSNSQSFTKELFRPMSFFLEPSAYVLYMILPLFISLIRKQIIYMAIIILSFFVSTSTTGIATALIIPGIYVLRSNIKFKNKLGMSVLIAVLFISLFSFSFFSGGIEKIDNTDFESNVRLAQGPMFVAAMPASDYLLGCNYATTYDYYKSGALGSIDVIVYGDNLYLTAFWYLIAKYGIIGLSLYVSCYVGLMKRKKELIPYIICALVLLFTSEKTFSGVFVYEMIFLQAFLFGGGFINQSMINRNESNTYRVRTW